MLVPLLEWIDLVYNPPGFGMFSFITVRSAFAAATAFLICLLFGNRIIRLLKKLQLGETIRDDIGLDNHLSKAGTPSMGGLIILFAIIVPSLMWIRPNNIYGWLILFVVVALGAVGFLDDYIKIVKKDKKGLMGRVKLSGQILVGLILGSVLYFYPDFSEYNTLSTIPFVKDTNINYAFLGDTLGWVIYIPVVIFIIAAVSNAVNLTDGLDGLASGTTAIAGLALGILTYVSGRVDYSSFLDILYLPGVGELTIFCAALAGACFGFLWFNSYPAQVFMGDTGSLALGGSIGAIALMVHKELLLPILCGVFFMETLSVIIQTTYFKYTRRKYGEGRRFYRMAPLHHHFEKMGLPEPKIVVRFWIVAIMLAVLTIITLKIR
ncbi:MAG: phospho-N-acetylmuramoyl-pentapeptide-transferase [Rhodothermaceae bacterium]|nr:phospho-N-acetylmuramoyl-pentapeptide-transferase [Rhodothermaceae bacterium]